MPIQTFNMTPTPSSASMIGSALGTGAGKRLGLYEAEQAIMNAGNDPVKLAMAMNRASMLNPNLDRSLGQMYDILVKRQQAINSQNAPFGPEGQATQTPQNIKLENDLNSYLSGSSGQAPAQFPTSEMPGKTPNLPSSGGQLPQEVTTGQKEPVLSNQQMLSMSKPYAEQKTAQGIPTTPAEAYEELKAINADRISANQQVDVEQQKRIASQREYGEKVNQAVNKLLPDASDEVKAYLRRQGEKAASSSKSEADVDRKIAEQVRIYKNNLSNLETTKAPNRLYNAPFRAIGGGSKSFNQSIEDARKKAAPFVEAGLFDPARAALSKAGFYPEEREMVLANLSEPALKNINQLPQIADPLEASRGDAAYNLPDYEKFNSNLNSVLQSDPSTNLILLRREYEKKKGVDWRMFKDGINKSIDEGVFKPSPDQFNQLNDLESPPLNQLDYFLHGLGIVGR